MYVHFSLMLLEFNDYFIHFIGKSRRRCEIMTLFESVFGITISELGVRFLSSICMACFILRVSWHKNCIIIVGAVIISNIFVF